MALLFQYEMVCNFRTEPLRTGDGFRRRRPAPDGRPAALPGRGAGIVFRRTLLLAASSNLTFAYVVFAALSWLRTRAPLEVSLSEQDPILTNTETIAPTALLALCLLSFAVSHLFYIQKTISEIR